jgi:hypothetical protein
MEDIHTNLALHALVAELIVFCPYKDQGCPVTTKYESLNTHINTTCLFIPKKCSYSTYGCDFSGIGTTLADHLQNCPYHALRAFIKNCDQRISHLETIVMVCGMEN